MEKARNGLVNYKHVPMRILKMTNDNYNKVRSMLDGAAFHKPKGDGHYEMKFVSKKIENQYLDIFKSRGVEYEDTGRTE